MGYKEGAIDGFLTMEQQQQQKTSCLGFLFEEKMSRIGRRSSSSTYLFCSNIRMMYKEDGENNKRKKIRIIYLLFRVSSLSITYYAV